MRRAIRLVRRHLGVPSRVTALESELAARTLDLVNLGSRFAALRTEVDQMRHSLVPEVPVATAETADSAFMAYSTCSAADIMRPRYAAICHMFNSVPRFHRKQWEWVFVIHHLAEAGLLVPGTRGLGFGVGDEPLPAVFAAAGAHVTATDAPQDSEAAATWRAFGDLQGRLAHLAEMRIAPASVLRERVAYGPCDMNDIDSEFTGYDFHWSSCSLEHLGSAQAGFDFVVEAVTRTLRPGGVGVHTTECQVLRDRPTFDDGVTVVYSQNDIAELITRLRSLGHEAHEFIVSPNQHPLDWHVDVPPYVVDMHLKLRLSDQLSTSAGIVVRRGG
jgi:hypothetical protein